MSHDVIYFPSEKYFSDRIYVCPMDPSEPSESRFVHRSQIASIGHIWGGWVGGGLFMHLRFPDEFLCGGAEREYKNFPLPNVSFSYTDILKFLFHFFQMLQNH